MPQQPPLIQQKIRYRLVWNHARRLNRRGEGLIQIEAQQGRRRRYFSTRTYCRPDEWRDGWLTGTTDDTARNYALRRMMWEVEQVELEYLKRGQRVTLPMLSEAVRTNVNPAARLRDFGLAMLQDGDRKELTRANYRTLLNDIDRFRPNTYLTDVDYQWVMQYDAYLKQSAVAHNTRVSRLRMLRALMNEAQRRDLTFCDPFRRIKIEQMEAKHGYLTATQLRSLERLKLTGRTDRCRDLFLIGCYTGLRYSDIKTLRQTDIDRDGWIRKQTQKTGITVEIPTRILFDGRFERLQAKYQGDIGNLCKQTPTNSDANRLLHPLFQRIGATDKATFHTSRHTFATLLGMKGVPLETVQRLLGHTTPQMTAIYNEAKADVKGEIEKGLGKIKKLKN